MKNTALKIPQERKASLLCATTMNEVEHLTAVYKGQSKRTYAERARELGLQPAATEVLQGLHNKFVCFLYSKNFYLLVSDNLVH